VGESTACAVYLNIKHYEVTAHNYQNWYQRHRVLKPHAIDHGHFTRFRCQLGAMDLNIKLVVDDSTGFAATSVTFRHQIEAVDKF